MRFRRILSFVLALVMVLCCVNVNMETRAAEKTPEEIAAEEALAKAMDVRKEINWPLTDGAGGEDKNRAQIVISSNVVDMAETQVLFLGTLCDGHGMSANTLVRSLNAIATNADVTYYLLDQDHNKTDERVIKKQGTLKRGESVTRQSLNVSLDAPRHYALKGFLNTIYDELITKKNQYDYIVLEFDCSRIADSFKYDDFNSNYSGRMDKIAEVLAEYYAENKVIWITDNQLSLKESVSETLMNSSTGKLETRSSEKTYYVPRKFYYNNQYNYLSSKQFRALCALTAPAYYLAHTDASDTKYYGAVDSITGEKSYRESRDMILGNEYRPALAEKEYSEVYGANVYKKTSRQLDYNNADELSDFLYMAIEAAMLEFVDQVQVSDELTVLGASLYSTDKDSPAESDWKVMGQLTVKGSLVKTGADGVKYAEDENGIIRITTGNEDSAKNNLVDVVARGLKSRYQKRVKLVIEVEDKDGFVSCVYWDETANDGKGAWMMNPNDGDAIIKLYTSETNKAEGTAATAATAAAVAANIEEFTVESRVVGGTEAVDSANQDGASEVTGGHSIISYEKARVKVDYTPGADADNQIVTIDGKEITLSGGSYTATDAVTGEKISVTADASHKVSITIEGLAADHSLKVEYVSDTTVVYNLTEDSEAPADYVKPADAVVPYNTEYDAAVTESVNGYSFAGWYTDAALTLPYVKAKMTGSNYSLTEDHTLNLYGKWSFDLALEKSVNKKTAKGGDELTYTITVNNEGDTAATGVSVSDSLNSNLVFVSADNGGSYSAESGSVSWSNLTVPAGGLVLTLKVKVKDTLSADADITNTAAGKLGDKEFTNAEVPSTAAEPKTLPVTYSYVGETVPDGKIPPTENDQRYGTAYTAKDRDSAAGYVFSGWFTDEACKTAYTDGTAITGALQLYGKWELKVSAGKTVDKETAKGGDTLVYTITLKNESAAKVTVAAVSDTLDTRLEYVSSDNGGAYSAGTVSWTDVEVAAGSTKELKLTAKVKADLREDADISNTAEVSFDGRTITAELEKPTAAVPQTFPVTYSYMGTIVPQGKTAPTESEQNYGTAYTAKDKDSAAGYAFAGWYTDEACKTAYTDGTEITDALKLYGKWELKVSAEKTVDKETAKGGDTLVYTITLKNESAAKVTVPEVSDTLDANLVFVSADNSGAYSNGTVTWKDVEIAAGGTKALTVTATVSGTLTAESTEIGNTAEVSFDGRTLTAAVDKPTDAAPKQLSVTYNYVGSVPAGAESVKPARRTDVNYGSEYSAEADPFLSGYVFDGWYTDSSCESAFAFGTAVLTTDINLYGKWSFGLSIEKTVSKTTAKGGEELVYTIAVSNATGSAVSGVNVEDSLNENLLFVAASPAPTSAPEENSNGTVRWTGITVPAAGLTLTLTVRVDPALTAVTEIGNTAEASFGEEKFGNSTDAPVTASPRLIKVKYIFVEEVKEEKLPAGAAALRPAEAEVPYGSEYTCADVLSLSGYCFTGWHLDPEQTALYPKMPVKEKQLRGAKGEISKTALLEENYDLTDGVLKLYGSFSFGLAMTKSANKIMAVGGEEISYTISLTNKTGAAVSGVAVTDALDANLLFVSASPEAAATPAAGENGMVSWTGLTVPDTGLTLTLKARVKDTLTTSVTVANKAEAAFGEESFDASSATVAASPKLMKASYSYMGTVPEGASAVKPADVTNIPYGSSYEAEDAPVLAGYVFDGWYVNGIAFASGSVTENLMLIGSWSNGISMEKTVDKTTAKGGDQLVYSIVITNASAAEITGVKVSDTLNENLKFVSATADGAFKESKGTVEWTDLSVAAEDTLTLTLTVMVKKELSEITAIGNTAEGSFGKETFSDTADPVNAEPSLVTVSYMGGSDTPKDAVLPGSEEALFGEAFTPADMSGKVKGYVFLGWFTDEACTKPFESGTVLNGTNTSDGALTLYGQWEEIIQPKNGDLMGLWLTLFAVSGIGLTALGYAEKKEKKQKRA